MKDFKLLAIRPLKKEINNIEYHCEKNILKGLKHNFIYRFYNDFIFLDRNGNEITNDTEYIEIESIKHKRSLPNNFYGDNINICAVVGKNGSGKSSLLELFYYFLYIYSLYEGLLNNQNIAAGYRKDFFIEFYYQFEDCIYCLKWNNINNFTKTSYIKNLENNNLHIKDHSNIESFENGNSYMMPIYTIVTNYSIYGLNSSSEQDRWLDKLFIKNDGYQTPIVLTPYRENGNIDINSEFELANSRLLKVFLLSSEKNELKTTALIRDLSIQKLLFKLDIKKNLNIYFNNKTFEIEEVVNQFELINKHSHELFFKKLYRFFKKKTNYRKLIYSYSKIDFQDSSKFMNECFNLSNLYIFKKIVKIVFNYKTYKGFQPLFSDEVKIGNLNSDNDLPVLFIAQYVKLFSPSETNLNVKQFIDLSRRRSYYVDENFLEKIDLMKRNILKHYFNFYDEAIINAEYEKTSKYINKKRVSVFEVINSFINDFNEKLASANFREIYISNLLSKLSLDTSHVTLKLRQVLNMQESNFFNFLSLSDQKNTSEEDDIIYFSVNKNYFDKVKVLKDEEIPNAFLEALFFFKKANLNSDFELKYLSSGEQQLLHSFISLLYHIDNILSVVENEEANANPDSKILRYKAINIILDEIELYYHPEYQRIYIDSLLVLLKQKKYEKLNFNIIFSTHSPFILSDIPNQNILKLKNGEPDYIKDSTNSFGANIHDLLADEFFLENGFMGEFASKKIKTIFDTISDVDLAINIDDYDSLVQEINIIGEHVLRKPLLEILDKKFQKHLDNKTLIEFYQKKIKELSK